MSEYNYTTFRADHADFDGFPGAPNVGTFAPDFELEDLASGESIRLASLWKRATVIMEFGSYS